MRLWSIATTLKYKATMGAEIPKKEKKIHANEYIEVEMKTKDKKYHKVKKTL